MLIVQCILITILAIMPIACFVMLFKTHVTFKKRNVIIDAIYAYHKHCIWQNVNIVVGYSDMESYNKTDNRIWDWGYTRILPKEKFEIIKPYIGLPSCYGTIANPSDIAANGCYDCKYKAQCFKFKKGNNKNAR